MDALNRRALLFTGGTIPLLVPDVLGARETSETVTELSEVAGLRIVGQSRSTFVTENSAGTFHTLPDGAVTLTADGLAYIRRAETVAIPDLSGWVPGGDFVSLGHFGAVGDGKADDTSAWSSFQAASGAHVIPKGDYLVDGVVKSFSSGAVGNGPVESNLTTTQRAKVTTGLDDFLANRARIAVSSEFGDAEIQPAIHVSTCIDDDSGAAYDAKVAGIYSYMEQTGSNTQQYPKAIAGTAVNAASGNNDATGVVGYAYKLDVSGGLGDAAGNGGSAWQYSTEEGLVIGGEFSAHQNVAGTFASDVAKSGNNTMSLHATTNSIGSRAFAGIALDTFGSNAGRYGFWNAVLISRSCFMEDGAGEGVEGTVGINFGNNTVAWADKDVKFANANHHLWRSGAGAIRCHCSTFDIENTESGAIGVRLVTPSDDPQNAYFSGYRGALGPDGNTALEVAGGLTVDLNGYTYLTSYRGSAETYSRVGCSPKSDAFLPLSSAGSGSMSLGTSSSQWSQVYASAGAINTSDERYKTDIEDIPDEVLDAWGEVGFMQFRMRDAVTEKGEGARLHNGVIAQRISEAFEAAGLDATDYGLLCYDAWEAVPDTCSVERVIKKHAVYEQVLLSEAVYDVSGQEIKPVQYVDGDLLEPEEYEEITHVNRGVEAGSRYGVRYEEALCLEAAYQRRRADRLAARLSAIEAKVDEIMAAL